jgi:hypothetical protein
VNTWYATAAQGALASSALQSVNLGYNVGTRQITNTGGTAATLPLFGASGAGLVPGVASSTTQFLRADGTWSAPPTSTGVTSVSGNLPVTVATGTTTPFISVNVATTSAAGVMSAADKTKLDTLTAGASGTVTNVTGSGAITVATGTTTPAISIAPASSSVPGTMSATDKQKLDTVQNQATRNVGVLTPSAPLIGGTFDGAVNVGWSVSAASLSAAGVVQLSENYNTITPSTTEAPTVRALTQVHFAARKNEPTVLALGAASLVNMPAGTTNNLAVVGAGVTRLTFDPAIILNGTVYNIFNDAGVILDIVVATRGFIHRAGTGYIVATVASPAKLPLNGLLNVWFTGGVGGFAFARGLT